MKILAHVDPVTGRQVWRHSHYADGTITYETREDTTPWKEVASADRADDQMTTDGIKKGMWKYATLPPIILDDLFRKGINPFANKDMLKETFKIINRDYPALKTTEKWHKR